MKKILVAASTLLWTFSAAFADGEKDASANVPVKKWTFIVYMNGDNNLDSFSDANLNQMKAVGSTDDVNIIVLRDRNNQSISSKILRVAKNKFETVKDFHKNLDMGDYHTMIDLFQYARQNYPAEHYAFDIWDHGGGWGLKDFVPTFRDISWDDGTGHFISTPEMGKALAEMVKLNDGKKIDLVGTDACLMQMIEVENEVSPSITAMVASEETEPGAGWDYTAPLTFLTKNPKANAFQFGDSIAKAYLTTGSSGLQQSVVSSEALIPLKEKISVFADKLSAFNVLSKTKVVEIIGQTKGFTYDDFKDIIDFCKRVVAVAPQGELKAAAADVLEATKAAIKSNYTNIPDANGLSIWLPDANTYESKKARYSELNWAKTNHWASFLSELYK